MIGFRPRTEAGIRYLRAIQSGVSQQRLDRVIDGVAGETLAKVIAETPKGWTQKTRKAWKIENLGLCKRRVINPTRTMYWLEFGTRDHGPVRAKCLYIPLTKRAQLYINNGFGSLFTVLKSGRRVKLIYGVDYVLAKRVRGIIGMRIAEIEAYKARQRLRLAMILHLQFIKNQLNGSTQ